MFCLLFFREINFTKFCSCLFTIHTRPRPLIERLLDPRTGPEADEPKSQEASVGSIFSRGLNSYNWPRPNSACLALNSSSTVEKKLIGINCILFTSIWRNFLFCLNLQIHYINRCFFLIWCYEKFSSGITETWSEENISKNVDFSLWGNRAPTHIWNWKFFHVLDHYVEVPTAFSLNQGNFQLGPAIVLWWRLSLSRK